MPTTTTCRCHTCCVLRTRMSIFESLCLECFNTRYVLCFNCGALVYRDDALSRYMIDGEYHCHGCYYHLRERSCTYWHPKPFDVSFATYQHIRSKRKYGVEIETANCPHHRDLIGRTNFGCKPDPTVDGAEFDSPILYGDEGLEYITDFLAFANEKHWSVDQRCGCHTHYDVREETDEQLYSMAYAYNLTYPMWKCCVPSFRVSNSYCRAPSYTHWDVRRAYKDNREFTNFADDHDRYEFVNLQAYGQHGTFEIRLLEGTLNAIEIIAWITLHCRFMDCVKELPFEKLSPLFDRPANQQFRNLVSLIDDTDLTNWMAARARYIGRHPLRGPNSVNP